MLTRLLLLWLLSEGPSHPYALVRALSDEGFAFWCPVERGSVYAVLRTLVREGSVRKKGTERPGRRPRRTVYAITPEGRSRYRELLVRAWSELPVLADPFNAALAARADLAPAEIAGAAAARAAALARRVEDSERHRRAAPDRAIADRSVVLAQAELGWLRRAVLRGGAP
jgi:DNA-binding PadR family transcriptional regulator